MFGRTHEWNERGQVPVTPCNSAAEVRALARKMKARLPVRVVAPARPVVPPIPAPAERRLTGPSSRAKKLLIEVCREHRVKYAELVSPCRSRRLCVVRQEAMHRLSRLGLEMASIGRLLGRDPTTVRYNILARLRRARGGGQ